jgi:DNA-binding transcriptional LysR family regulator
MDRLDLRLVEYFVTVAEEMHFGRAAERLHIAQPSLSQQVRRLEQQLRVTLLERDSRNVHLTAAGEALLSEGRKILSQAQHVIRTTRAAPTEQLAVGFYGSAANVLLPQVLKAFTEARPGIEVTVRELLFGSIDDILDGSVAVAFTRLLPEQTELDVEVLTEEARVAALACEHPLAARETLVFADLRNESFVVNPMLSGDSSPARWIAEQRLHSLRGRVAVEASSIPELLTLVASGRGVCLVPSTVAREYARSDVVYVPVLDAEPAVVSLARRQGEPSAGARAFWDIVHDVAGAMEGTVPSAQ